MLTKNCLLVSGLILAMGVGVRANEIVTIHPSQLAGQPVAVGPAREALPANGALVHLQLRDVMSVLEGVEEILVSGVPEKLLPPEAQELFGSDHPVLTLLGFQAFQQPITPELFREQTGLDPRGTATLTLYLGDPRRMFIVGLPPGSRSALANLLNGLLRPSTVEEVSLSGRQVLRVKSAQLGFVPELYVLATGEMVYVCGDRSLVTALINTPAAQRMGQDRFFARELPVEDGSQFRLVLNPASIKPFAMQLQAVTGIAGMLIPQQRQNLLGGLPAEAREQLEMQVQTQLGVQDLNQFADYAECVVLATLEQITDAVTRHATAFEGMTITGNLRGNFEQLSVKVHSQKYEQAVGAAAIPMAEVRRALAWLGPDYQSFSVTGRKTVLKDHPVLSDWAQRVQSKFEARGLASVALTRLVSLLEDQKSIPTVEDRARWTLTVQAPLRPLPDIEHAASIEEYFQTLELPVWRPVQVIPGRDLAFLESCFREETEARNLNRQSKQEFIDSFQKQRPLFERSHRYYSTQLDGGMMCYTRESSWMTRGGLFGYDQHELVNRKMVWARQIGEYVIYHRGVSASPWLADLEQSVPNRVVPGVQRLLDRVPEGVNGISVSRVMVGLPAFVDWVDSVEARLHADVEAYLAKAQAVVDSQPDIETAIPEIRKLRMPLLVGSVGYSSDQGKVYALLPTGEAALMLPRSRLVPLVKELLADFAAKADGVGGALTYTRQGDGTLEWTAVQSWESLALLTRTVGNSLAEHYLAAPDGQQALQKRLVAPRDMDPSAFDEVIARNPQWRFIPQPQRRTEAKAGEAIPERSAEAGAKLVDLTSHYNAVLDESWHQGGLANNTLADFEPGLRELDGTLFDARGIVQLSGAQAARELRVKFPAEVNGIAVNQKANRLRFLHACGWSSPRGTQIGSYTVHYQNGASRVIPIIYGQDVQDWWMNEPLPTDSNLKVGWQGKNQAISDGPPVGLYLTTWNNPESELMITSIDYQSAMANSAPFLVAITLE